MPAIMQGTPTHASSNMVSPLSGLCSTSLLFTTMVVLVPIRVHIPPRMAAKLSGMNRWLTEMRCLRDQSLRIGIINATTGVLFRNALNSAAGTIVRS